MNEIGSDPDAFEAFYREHLGFVRSFVARRVDDPHTAADLTADIFVAVIESAHRYQSGSGPAVAWLAGIARNVVAGHLRTQARELRAMSRIRGRALLDDASIERIAQRLDVERSTRALYRSLDALPATQRDVVESSPSTASASLRPRQRSASRPARHAPDITEPAPDSNPNSRPN